MKRYKKKNIVENNVIGQQSILSDQIFSNSIIKYFDFKEQRYGRYIFLGNLVWFNDTCNVMLGSDIRIKELELEYKKMVRIEKLDRILRLGLKLKDEEV